MSYEGLPFLANLADWRGLVRSLEARLEESRGIGVEDGYRLRTIARNKGNLRDGRSSYSTNLPHNECEKVNS